MHDRRVEAGLDGLVQKDRVERLAGRGIEPEGDVGQPEDGRDPRQLLLDPADRLEGLDPVAPALLHPGRQGQRQGIEDQVLCLEAIAGDGDVPDGPGGAHLPVGRACLTLLVDAGAHDGRAVLPGQSQERVEARALTVPVLQVDGVEDAPAAEPVEGGAHDRTLGRVDHQGDAGLRGEAARHLRHVGHPVGTGVVDAHVDDVGPLLDLVLRHGHAGVPVRAQHGLPEALRAVGVGALTDHQEARVLVERDLAVDGGGGRLEHRLAIGRSEACAALDHGLEVGRRRPAAPSDDGDPETGDELVVVVGELVRGEVVVHGAFHHRGQARVGDTRDRDPARRREVPEGLAHLGGARGAVEPDHVHPHGVERGEGGLDLGARQHPAGELDRHLQLEGHAPAEACHRPTGAPDGRLGLQQVVDGLDEQEIDAAGDQAVRLLLVGVPEIGERDLPEGGELGARPHAPRHPAGAVDRSVLVRHPAGQVATRPR